MSAADLHREFIDYPADDRVCEAHVAHDPAVPGRRPCVVVCHAWDGQNDAIRARTDQLARLGPVGFAIDLYGKGVRGDEKGDNSALMQPLVADRELLRRRLGAGLAAARAHPRVDPDRLVVIGYCFGGMAALDAARFNAPGVRGVVSVHGVLTPPPAAAPARITARVLVLHGWSDPVTPPEIVLAAARELTDAGADWQLHAYGRAMHAFTFVGADLPERGIVHHPAAERRAWLAIQHFLAEIL